METKEIENIVGNGFKELEGKVDVKLKAQFDAKKAEFIKEIEEKGYTSKEDVQGLIKEKSDAWQKQFDELATKMNKQNPQEGKKANFFDSLSKSLEENVDGLKSMKDGRSSDMRMKAPGDLNFGDFTGNSYESVTTDSRGLVQTPFAPLWLRNVLPNGNATGSTIHYLRETGGTGAAGVWDGTGDIDALAEKPGVGFTFEEVTQTLTWIAGITRVKREMLDDIDWLRTYLTQQLTVGRRGLFVAENTQIMNALTANSTAYDGANTVPVEMIYDAAFGQLRDNYYNPTTILMNHRDVVNLIALNKATGSGEYDLPLGTVAVVNNQLSLGGIPVIGVPNVDAGEFLVFDRNATQFVNRMQPEVRFFEQDRDNVPKNLVTVRAEERIATLVYDANAIVQGTFATTPEV